MRAPTLEHMLEFHTLLAVQPSLPARDRSFEEHRLAPVEAHSRVAWAKLNARSAQAKGTKLHTPSLEVQHTMVDSTKSRSPITLICTCYVFVCI